MSTTFAYTDTATARRRGLLRLGLGVAQMVGAGTAATLLAIGGLNRAVFLVFFATTALTVVSVVVFGNKR